MDEQALSKAGPHRISGYQTPGPGSRPDFFAALSIAVGIRYSTQEQDRCIKPGRALPKLTFTCQRRTKTLACLALDLINPGDTRPRCPGKLLLRQHAHPVAGVEQMLPACVGPGHQLRAVLEQPQGLRALQPAQVTATWKVACSILLIEAPSLQIGLGVILAKEGIF